MKRIFVSVLCLLSMVTLSAATYYCSPAGGGSGSAYSSPCSLSIGLSRLQNPGDTLYLLGGQYDLGNTPLQNLNGSSLKRIVISGYPGEQAILDFRTTPYGTRGLQVKSTCTYLHLKDLTLRYSGKNNLYCEGSYCLFEHLDIYGSADTGCQMKNGGNNTIKNVDSHDNFDYKNGSISSADFGGNADGFADKQHSGAPNHYIGCRSWNNSDDGWDFYQRATASETIIENCICYMNGMAEYDMRNHPRYQTDKAWFDEVNGATITNRYGQQQVVTLQHYPNHGNGNGFKMGGAYTDHKVLIHHCLSVANNVRGFDQNNNGGTMRVYNNTGLLNGINFGFTTSYGTLYIQNNISYRGVSADATRSQTTMVNTYNSWNGMTASSSDFQSQDTTQILASRQANGDLPAIMLMHLAPGSQYIDAGVNVGLEYAGPAPDLGCYETDGIVRPSLVITSGPEEQWVLVGDSISPVTIKWGGSTNKAKHSEPAGIMCKVSNTNQTLTFTGAIQTPGLYTITATTDADSNNVSVSAVIHVKSNVGRKVAFVSLPDADEDQLLLSHLNRCDSLLVTLVSANDANVDYSPYDLVVLGPKPSSGATGIVPLKTVAKPMLILKPFVFKNTVWNWGTAVNTADTYMQVQQPTHPIFTNLPLDSNNQLQVFSGVNTNAVTAVSTWVAASPTVLAVAPSNANYQCIAEFPVGSVSNGTTMTEPRLMLGVSEYSTSQLSESGLQLISNACYYLLGIPISEPVTALDTVQSQQTATKFIHNGQLLIRVNQHIYDTYGRCIK